MCVKIGCVVWAVDLRKKNSYIELTHTYILTFYTKNSHWCTVTFHHCVIPEPIAMEFVALIDPAYAIKYGKFMVLFDHRVGV